MHTCACKGVSDACIHGVWQKGERVVEIAYHDSVRNAVVIEGVGIRAQMHKLAWRAARLTSTTCRIDRREEWRYNNHDHHHLDWSESSRVRQFHRHRPIFCPKISTLPIFVFNTISSNHSNHSDVFT
jgi:hypothetical protein